MGKTIKGSCHSSNGIDPALIKFPLLLNRGIRAKTEENDKLYFKKSHFRSKQRT
jgi:hypothetical protein